MQFRGHEGNKGGTDFIACLESRSDNVTKNLFHFGILNTMYLWSMMKKRAQPVWWESAHGGGGKIWLHEYLISRIEFSVNWPGSEQFMNQTNLH